MTKFKPLMPMLLALLLAPAGGAWAENGLAAQRLAASNEEMVKQLKGVASTLKAMDEKLARLLDDQWEYRFMQRNLLSDLTDDIAKLGRDGWELITVTEQEGFVFKRRRQGRR